MFNRRRKCSSEQSPAQNKIFPPDPKYMGYQFINVLNFQVEKDSFFSVFKKFGVIIL